MAEDKDKTDGQILKDGLVSTGKWVGKTIKKIPGKVVGLPKTIIEALPKDSLTMGFKRATARPLSGMGIGEDWKITPHRAIRSSSKKLGIEWSMSAKVAGGEKKISLDLPRYLLSGTEIKEFEAWKLRAENGTLENSQNKLAILDKALKEFGGGVSTESSPSTRDPYKTIIIIKIDPNQSNEKLEAQVQLIFNALGIEGEKKGAARSAVKRLIMHRDSDWEEKPNFNKYTPQPNNSTKALETLKAQEQPPTAADIKAAAEGLAISNLNLQPHQGTSVTPDTTPLTSRVSCTKTQ